jgi:hypothetical protein
MTMDEEDRDRELERARELREQGDPGAQDVVDTILGEMSAEWADIESRLPELRKVEVGTRIVWTDLPARPVHDDHRRPGEVWRIASDVPEDHHRAEARRRRRLAAPVHDLREGPLRP